MTTAIQPKENKTPLSKYLTTGDVKAWIQDAVYSENDPKRLIRGLSEILPKAMSRNKREAKKAKALLREQAMQISMATGLDNHYHLVQAVRKKYGPLVLSLVQEIEKDHQCTNALEKAAAEIVALAHVRMICDQKNLDDFLGCLEEVDDASTRYATFLSKQADRSHRQLLTAISTLKQLKQPTLEVNIKAQNAFVAQNQQINANHKPS